MTDLYITYVFMCWGLGTGAIFTLNKLRSNEWEKEYYTCVLKSIWHWPWPSLKQEGKICIK
jgi:hypothetical protein